MKLGRRLTTGWTVLLLCPCLSLVSIPSVAADESTSKQCQLGRYASLDMLTQPDGQFVVPVTINDRPMQMLVDTGGYSSSISVEVAEQLGVKRNWTPYGGAFLNNVTLDEYAYLDSLQVGPLRSSDRWQVLIIPADINSQSVAGLLGPDFMANYDVEFDFFRGKFNLFRHNTCPGHAVYWTHDAYAAVPMTLDRGFHITVQALLDGKPVTIIIDTGTTNSVMSLDTARELFGWSDNDLRLKSLGSQSINGGAETPQYSFPFASLNFEGIAISNPQIILIPREHYNLGRHHDASIVLGMSVLRQLHMYVAYQEGMLYLTSAEAQ